MALKLLITKIKAREILDSRGNPTVEAEVVVETETTGKKIMGRAAVPSGASTGQFEAVELRDGGSRYQGQGVTKAVKNVNGKIAKELTGKNVLRQRSIDERMIQLDGTENKEKLGANAMLSVSLACAKAAAKALKMPLYRYLGGVGAENIPIPMMNILNGGAHSDNNVDIQEFMILPVGAPGIREGVRWCAEVYQTLKKLLKERGLSTAVGDEGGFAPNLNTDEEAIEIILEAIKAAGYSVGEDKDFMISLDVAASEWKLKKSEEKKKGLDWIQKGDIEKLKNIVLQEADSEESAPSEAVQYCLPKKGTVYQTDEMITYWESLITKYPIYSIEDPLDEEDWDGWKRLTDKIGEKVILVGDDLFVTNAKRLKKGIKMGCANAILIKPNQIGTLSETIETIQLAKDYGYVTIMSHRSGETEDTTIADISVGLGTELIKTGAPCRAERTAKYNQLMRIEETLL